MTELKINSLLRRKADGVFYSVIGVKPSSCGNYTFLEAINFKTRFIHCFRTVEEILDQFEEVYE